MVLRDHKRSWLIWKNTAPKSKINMESNKWDVWFAPPPNDINWHNLSNKRLTLVKKTLANLFIFVVAFFLTTPQFVVHLLEPIFTALKNTTTPPPIYQNEMILNPTNVTARSNLQKMKVQIM